MRQSTHEDPVTDSGLTSAGQKTEFRLRRLREDYSVESKMDLDTWNVICSQTDVNAQRTGTRKSRAESRARTYIYKRPRHAMLADVIEDFPPPTSPDAPSRLSDDDVASPLCPVGLRVPYSTAPTLDILLVYYPRGPRGRGSSRDPCDGSE